MNSTVTTEDKRKEYRFPTDANVEIRSNSQQKFYAACCNISSSGIMMMSNHAFKPSDQLNLKIIEAGKLVVAKATVLYCQENPQGYYVGCTASFSEID